MEDELEPKKEYLSLSQIILTGKNEANILTSKYGFSFIPSTLKPSEIKYLEENFNASFITKLFTVFDFVIFDCQAGYSNITETLLRISDKNIIVMEADAVSSAALRVLYLQLSKNLNRKSTWQIFNKLTEEERKIYGNITDGTFFLNLPPVPFDWKVKSSFALGKIPSLFENDSVFGLAILRFLKIVLKEHSNELDTVEQKAVGDWYTDILKKVEKLQIEKYEINYKIKNEKRRAYQRQMYYISWGVLLISLAITLFTLYDFKYYMAYVIGAIGVMISALIPFYTNKKIKQDYKMDEDAVFLSQIEKELSNYKTLLNTDDRLNEYLKKNTPHNILYK